MSLPRALKLSPILLILLVGAAVTAGADGLADTYRRTAQTYRAMAATASGAARQCYSAYASYYDSVADSLSGGSPLPQPTCSLSAGPSPGTAPSGVGGFGGSLVPSGTGAGTALQQSQQLLTQGFGLIQMIMDNRAARREQERRIREAEERRQEEQRSRDEVLAQRRELEELQERIAEEKRREQQINDAACQLLVESRALLGQTVDLGGDNACSRITNAILDDLATYRPIGRGQVTTTTPPPDIVIDGSKIPSVIDFTRPDATAPGGTAALNNCQCGPDGTSGSPSLDRLVSGIEPHSGGKPPLSAADRLLGSLDDASNPRVGAQNGAYPQAVVDKLNLLLDAAVVMPGNRR